MLKGVDTVYSHISNLELRIQCTRTHFFMYHFYIRFSTRILISIKLSFPGYQDI